MWIFGLFLAIIAVFILYKRFVLILFGKRATGTIIGYGNAVKSIRGVEAYNYKVRYQYLKKEYIAFALESVSVSHGNIPRENLHREVTIYFRENRPDLVTIKDFYGVTIIGVVLLILSIFSFFM